MPDSREIPVIETARLLLTLPPPECAPQVIAFYEENRAHLDPWSPPLPPEYYTEDFWRERLAAARASFQQDKSLSLVLFNRQEPMGRVLGICNFSNIMRGPFQACFLGYNLDGRAVGQGLMFEALQAAIAFVFAELRLHRIMANYLPINERSGRLLRRLGFTVEGYARDYLFIAGAWRDHIMTALVNPAMHDIS